MIPLSSLGKLSQSFVYDRYSNICQKIISPSYTLVGHLPESCKGFVNANSSKEHLEMKEESKPSC